MKKIAYPQMFPDQAAGAQINLPLPRWGGMIGMDEGVRKPVAVVDFSYLQVTNRYNTYSFDGQKSIVLSMTSWLGVYNPFLGVAFLVTGSISVILGGFYFGAASWVRPRRPGDLSVLTDWKM